MLLKSRGILFAALWSTLFPAEYSRAEEEKKIFELGKVVVTAERREESVQETPMSVDVLSGEDLEDSTVESTTDLQNRTTGLQFTTNAILGHPYIRGIGSNVMSVGGDPSVALYSDGVYQARPSSAWADFYDIERVEVLKGPQGVLYGRNATGGAIHIISKEPELDFSAGADLLYGNYNKVRSRAMVNAPLVEDQVYLRLSSLTSNRDGFTDVLNTGTTVDNEDLWALRGQMLVLPADNLEILFKTDFSRENGSRGLGVKVNDNFPSPQISYFGGTNPAEARKVRYDQDTWKRMENGSASGKITLDLESFSLSSLTSYHESRWHTELDNDATDAALAVTKALETSRTVAQELQATSTTPGPFQWLSGLYYLHEDGAQDVERIAAPIGLRLRFLGDSITDAYAAFAQGSYDITEKWRLSAGVRYSYEKKHFILDDKVNGALVKDRTKGWNTWTPKFGLEYFATKDVMTWFSATRGFKSGGFNSESGVGEEFNPEYIWNYEWGVKSTFFQGLLQVNASVFYYDFKDLQVYRPVEGVPAVLVIDNAAKADGKGGELTISSSPFQGLDMDAGLTVLKARFKDYATVDLDAPGGPTNVNLAGKSLPNAPDLAVFLGLQYHWPVMAWGEVTPRVEWKYQSEVFFSQFNADGVNQKGYSLVNARVEFETKDKAWVFALWGKNLGNALYNDNVFRHPVMGTLGIWGPPREFGLQAAYQY